MPGVSSALLVLSLVLTAGLGLVADDGLASSAPQAVEGLTASTGLEDGLESVLDDTHRFTVELPVAFHATTTAVDLGGIPVAHVSAATDLERYLAGDWATVGTSIYVAERSVVGSLEEALELVGPADDCAVQAAPAVLDAAIGRGLVQHFDGCGTAGTSGHVLGVVAVPAGDTIVIAGVRAPGPAAAASSALFSIVIASITPLD
jgi:hypothetical protein